MERSLENAPEEKPFTDPESLIRLMKKELKNKCLIHIGTPYEGEQNYINPDPLSGAGVNRMAAAILGLYGKDPVNDLSYLFINEDGEIEIKNFDKAKTKVEIPTNKNSNDGKIVISVDIAQQLLEEVAELTFMDKPEDQVDEWLNS